MRTWPRQGGGGDVPGSKDLKSKGRAAQAGSRWAGQQRKAGQSRKRHQPVCMEMNSQQGFASMIHLTLTPTGLSFSAYRRAN